MGFYLWLVCWFWLYLSKGLLMLEMWRWVLFFCWQGKYFIFISILFSSLIWEKRWWRHWVEDWAVQQVSAWATVYSTSLNSSIPWDDIAMVLQVLTLMVCFSIHSFIFLFLKNNSKFQATTHGHELSIPIRHNHNWSHSRPLLRSWKRYNQGLTAALVQDPLSRFGDTAANAGILALLQSNPYMKNLPPWFKLLLLVRL